MKIKNIIVGIIGIALLINCDSELDKSPGTSSLPDNAINTETDLQNALNGVYNAFQREGVYGKDVFAFGVTMSDIGFISIKNTNRLSTINDFTYTQFTGDVFDLWDDLYEVVQTSNFVINNQSLASSSTVDKIKAQAYAARGLAYLNLINYFGQNYGGINQELGVPIELDENVGDGLPRSTVSEVYTQIENDLLQAISLFESSGTSTSKNELTIDAANLILARTYLYMKDWDNAITYAEKVKASSGYTILSGDQYVQYWAAETGAESIFELTFTSSDALGRNSSLPYLLDQEVGYGDLVARASFVESMDDSDYRKQLYSIASRGDDPEGYATSKFPYESGAFPMKVLRYAEADFIIIESKYQKGDEAGALSDLNTFVANRSTKTYSSSGSQLLEDILLEKAYEFAFEGQRFLDLRRNEKEIVKSTNCVNNCTMTYPNDKFALPIPNAEINSNNSISQGDQNPSYNN
ncbi:hypothetical protein UJ101_01510 [Flavobacteriaceae bacterium UJ101]|nr:hypothetical protein UJ101_01510 [Flavobacteriaceae bacterium UJ101]